MQSVQNKESLQGFLTSQHCLLATSTPCNLSKGSHSHKWAPGARPAAPARAGWGTSGARPLNARPAASTPPPRCKKGVAWWQRGNVALTAGSRLTGMRHVGPQSLLHIHPRPSKVNRLRTTSAHKLAFVWPTPAALTAHLMRRWGASTKGSASRVPPSCDTPALRCSVTHRSCSATDGKEGGAATCR